MAAGDHEAATLRRYAETQARLEHAGGYAWRERLDSVTRNLGFATEDLERPLSTFSGGELTRASLARALGGDPDLLLLDEPTNHLDVASLEWLERELQSIDAAVLLVAHDRWFLEAVTNAVLELEAGRSTYFAGPWHNWRREKAARLAAATTAAEPRRRRHRPPRALRRALPLQEEPRQASPGEADAHRPAPEGARPSSAARSTLLTRRAKSLGFEFLQPKRSGRTVVEAEGVDLAAGDKELLADVSFAIERGEHVALVGPNGSGKTTLLETLLGRREPTPESCGSATASRPRTSRSTRSSSTRADPCSPLTQNATGLQRPAGAEPPRPLPLHGLGDARATGVACSRAASGGGSRSRSSSPPGRTCSCSTSRRTTSTSRAARRSRPRSTRFPARSCSSPTTARSWMRSPTGRSRSRTGRSAPTTAAGPSTWRPGTTSAPARRARAARSRRRKRSPRRPRRSPRPSELERLEADIAAREAEIADLERQLAEDWSNVDVVAAHRRARDDLQDAAHALGAALRALRT